MIKYFCDFCKKEMSMNIAKPTVEISVSVITQVNAGNKATQKAEHICVECNELLKSKLSDMGLEVSNGTTT